MGSGLETAVFSRSGPCATTLVTVLRWISSNRAISAIANRSPCAAMMVVALRAAERALEHGAEAAATLAPRHFATDTPATRLDGGDEALIAENRHGAQPRGSPRSTRNRGTALRQRTDLPTSTSPIDHHRETAGPQSRSSLGSCSTATVPARRPTRVVGNASPCVVPKRERRSDSRPDPTNRYGAATNRSRVSRSATDLLRRASASAR